MGVARQRWDIFCTVIDNFGDIGVCWRLARQLAAEFPLTVRLFVDDLPSFARLCPLLDVGAAEQCLAGVSIVAWHGELPGIVPAEVVIEAFACELPAGYRAAMAERPVKPLWLNLEYLSAEDWVSGCHGLPSLQSNGLSKYFFFPGFRAGTGGLLAERDLLARRRAFQADEPKQAAFLQGLGVVRTAGSRLVSLFAYENAAVSGLLTALAQAATPTLCLVPEGRILPEVLGSLGVAAAAPGTRISQGALTVQIVPFMAQEDYDRLLWASDVNFVRGEDSFVRAQWAGRPFIWQIYQQEQDAHLHKLAAFLDRLSGELSPKLAAALGEFSGGWNTGQFKAEAWAALQGQAASWQQQSERWSETLAELGDLASNLVQFCAVKV